MGEHPGQVGILSLGYRSKTSTFTLTDANYPIVHVLGLRQEATARVAAPPYLTCETLNIKEGTCLNMDHIP